MENIKSKNNSVWDLYQINLNKNTIYNIFTKAGNYRWWKSYFENKKVIILSWTIELISNDWNEDIKKTYKAWDSFIIPAWLNHIFYYPKDCEMIEVFPKWTKTKIYDRFYEMKKK